MRIDPTYALIAAMQIIPTCSMPECTDSGGSGSGSGTTDWDIEAIEVEDAEAFVASCQAESDDCPEWVAGLAESIADRLDPADAQYLQSLDLTAYDIDALSADPAFQHLMNLTVLTLAAEGVFEARFEAASAAAHLRRYKSTGSSALEREIDAFVNNLQAMVLTETLLRGVVVAMTTGAGYLCVGAPLQCAAVLAVSAVAAKAFGSETPPDELAELRALEESLSQASVAEHGTVQGDYVDLDARRNAEGDAADNGDVDSDGDGLPNDIDDDSDNDGTPDAEDWYALDPALCGDQDGDDCDDCSIEGIRSVDNDGADQDGDGNCDAGDTDIDGDSVNNEDDSDPHDRFVCEDSDFDGCDDCTNGLGAPDTSDDGDDADEDGLCDAGDPWTDADGDGVDAKDDLDPNDGHVCWDTDNDGCDDCSIHGSPHPDDDGVDYDGDGICDASDPDPDDDGDGLLGEADPDRTACSPRFVAVDGTVSAAGRNMYESGTIYLCPGTWYETRFNAGSRGETTDIEIVGDPAGSVLGFGHFAVSDTRLTFTDVEVVGEYEQPGWPGNFAWYGGCGDIIVNSSTLHAEYFNEYSECSDAGDTRSITFTDGCATKSNGDATVVVSEGNFPSDVAVFGTICGD